MSYYWYVVSVESVNKKTQVFFRPVNYWVLDVFFLELDEGESYQILPDGFSYIIRYGNRSNRIDLHRPFTEPLLIQSDFYAQFYIVKCRPTFIGRLTENNISFIKTHTVIQFLRRLDSKELRSLIPDTLDNILFYMRIKNGVTSISELKKRYQCTSSHITDGFKKTLGLSFRQYQEILSHIK